MRKETLKLVLTRLQPYRDMAEGFLLILDECNEEDEKLINDLYNDIIQNIKDIDSKEQLQKISNELKIIKERELIEDWKDKRDIEDLENLISNLD